ncbi:MAG: hypothetical protein ACREMP_01745 [Candidatus Tyrphobacter sp.]
MVQRLRSPWSPLLLIVCADAVAVVALCLLPSDMDRYWLAVAGNWTLSHGRVLQTLAGSWYPHRAWVDQEWLVSVSTAWTRMHGIYWLLEMLFAAAVIFGVCFVAYESIRTRTHPIVACAQVAVVSLGSVFFAQDRAQTLVWALLPALILLWRRAPWAAVPLLAIWANVHGSFPVAILWMVLHLDRRRIAPLVIATFATLANPVGWHLWAFTVDLARTARLAGYVNEWSPVLATYTGAVVALLALAPLWMRFAAGLSLRRPVRYGDLLFIALCAIGTVVAIRYSMLLFLSTATALGAAFRTTAKPMPFAMRAACTLFAAMVLAFTGRSLADRTPLDFSACAPLVRGERVFTDAFEIGSVVELDGGYANLDGRIDAFPPSTVAASSLVLRDPRDGEPIVDGSGATVLAIAGRFAPSTARWRLLQSCGYVRLYARR